MQILVTNRAVEFGQKVYTQVLFPRMLKQMEVTDWKLTLYPNEEEDEITRLRRDEMEVNLAQRMMMLGYKPELMEQGDRDIRFTYRQMNEQQDGAPPMPPGMQPPQGMSPGSGGPMAQQMGASPPGLLANAMPPSQPGGEGMGIRTPRGPASPQNRGSPGIGSPVTSVQQRGPPNSVAQNNSRALMNSRRIKGA